MATDVTPMRNFLLSDAPRRILFLDIDGVLNDHGFDEEAQSCLIKPQCVGLLNHVIRATGCRIVISSAWRYMIGKGTMTLTGFHYLLRTHGVAAEPNDLILGTTRLDASPYEKRIRQIEDWVNEYRHGLQRSGSEQFHFAIVDDLSADEMGIPSDDHYYSRRFVRTNGKSGLNSVSAQQIIDLFAEMEADDAQKFIEAQQDAIIGR